MKRLRTAVAWALHLAGLFLALAFTSFDPNPAEFGVSRPTNLCGPAGTFLARWFIEGFGIGAFILCFWLVLLGYLLQTGRPARPSPVKLVGLFTCMLTFGAFCQAAFPGKDFLGGGTAIGGLLGFETVWRLQGIFGRMWTLAATGLGVVAGALLMTDHLLPDLLRRGGTRVLAAPAATRKKDRRAPAGPEEKATARKKLARDLETVSAAVADLPPAEDAAGTPRKSRRGAAASEGDDAAAANPAPDAGPVPSVARPARPARGGGAAAAPPAGNADDLEPASDPADPGIDGSPEADEPDSPVPALQNPPSIRAAAPPVFADGIEVIRLAPDPKLRGKEKYELPPLTLLAEPQYLAERESDEAIQTKAAGLEQALLDYGVTSKVEEIERGPVITRFDISIARGTKIAKVTSLGDELAMSLGVQRVRIAPVKGRSVLGVEIPNRERETVYLREIALACDLRKRKIQIPLFLGKDAAGNPIVEDLTSMPHLLIAGRTGAGKSVFVNNLVLSILFTKYPEEVRLIMIDPKKVELEVYQHIPHLLTRVESNPKKATKILEWAVNQMEERYELLAATGQRHIATYNKLPAKVRQERLEKLYTPDEAAKLPSHLPYVVIIVDELADLMMCAGKDVEQAIARLAQKARAVGIHVVLATQRPSTDVITGLIKSNLPTRIAFQTRVGVDSRTILDRYGAEKLLDKGDMLYLSATSDEPKRIQGPFVSDEEVEKCVSYLREKASPMYTHHLEQVNAPTAPEAALSERDELFEAAVDCVMASGQASASHLQTRMNVGYARARRLVEMMGEAGFVGASQGAKPREILLTPEKWEEMRGRLHDGSAGERRSSSSSSSAGGGVRESGGGGRQLGGGGLEFVAASGDDGESHHA